MHQMIVNGVGSYIIFNIPGNPVVSIRKGWDNDGLCDCILGLRTDLCDRADFDGKDQNDAGQDHGIAGMHRCSLGRDRYL